MMSPNSGGWHVTMLSRPTSHALRHFLRVSSESCQSQKGFQVSGQWWFKKFKMVQVIRQKCQSPPWMVFWRIPLVVPWRRNLNQSMNSERKTKTTLKPKHLGGRPRQLSLSLSLVVVSPEKRDATVVTILRCILISIISFFSSTTHA